LRGDAPGVAFEILAAVLDALYDLNRHRDANTLPETIVSVIPRAIACDSAVYARIEPATRSFTLSSWPPDRFAGVHHNEAFRLHVQHHPLVAHFATMRDARAWSLHDFVSRAAFHRTALYQKLYRPLGIEFQLVMLIPYPDRAPRVLALNRRDQPFSEHDQQLLGLLWPHLTQAARNSRTAVLMEEVAMNTPPVRRDVAPWGGAYPAFDVRQVLGGEQRQRPYHASEADSRQRAHAPRLATMQARAVP
jgi:hypothetical protein